MPEQAPSALDDVRVLDLAGEMGQYCTKLLADLGADVIKVEPPGGDPVRNLPPFYHDEADPQKSLFWLNLNTSKRSVTLDLENPEGRRIFEKLAATADVVVESFEPGYLDGLGLGYEGLARLKPDIILTSVTGFGQTGPHARYKAPDIVGVAMGGVMWLAGEPQDPPNAPPWRQGFISASIIAAAATLMALYGRDVSGEGQHVDVSMQEALSIAQETAMQSWDMLQSLRNRGGERGMIPVNFPAIGAYQCKDGYVFGYVGTPGGAPWSVLLDWLIEEGAAEDLAKEPYLSFCRDLSVRTLVEMFRDTSKLGPGIQMLNHVDDVVKRFIAVRGKWEVYEGGQRRRLLIGIVSTPEDIANNPQLQHRRWLTAVEHPELGETLQYPGPPYRLAATPWAIRRRPPLPGEHNAEVFEGELGIANDELAKLSAEGVL
ncbi:MAG TPA: CoA transferase [Dehalococcoidia bacterium]|nr:CoA transferase [Dehalococcoidia bacterium]